MKYFKMADHGGRFEDLPGDVTRRLFWFFSIIYSNTRMTIGCVYSILIEMHLRIIDSIKKSKTNDRSTITLLAKRIWLYLEVSFKFLLSSGLYRIERI